MLKHERLAVLAWCGVECDRDLKGWLRARLEVHPNEELDVHEIVAGVPAERPRKFLDFVRDNLGFEVISEQGAAATAAVLAELSGRVLRGELPIDQLARIVNLLDANFIGPGDGRPYPEGLEVLWNALDNSDAAWTLSNQPKLREVLEKTERELSKLAQIN